MALNMFLKIDQIPGESTNKAHAGWMDVQTVSHGIAQSVGGAIGASGKQAAGRCDHQPITVTKEIDKASPKLNLFCCKGVQNLVVEIEMCAATGDESLVIKYKLKNAMITSVSVNNASIKDEPTETVAFSYEEIEWTYVEYDAAGKKKGQLVTSWNVATNTGK